MATITTIQLPEGDKRSIKIKPGERAEKTFTVTNVYGSRLRIGFQTQFDSPQQKKWAKPKEPVERDLGDQGSEQVTLVIDVPKDAAPGKYNLKLLVYSLKDPNLDFTLSDPIVIEVPAPDVVAAPVPKIKMWPWILAGVAVLLIVGGVITWVILSSGAKEPDVVVKPPPPDKPATQNPPAAQRACPYGADQCLPEFVWREAFAGDHVCVTPDVRAQTMADNRMAASRRSVRGGAYGPDTCLMGFVWREASPTDHVCVTGQTRTQASNDNLAARSRRDPECNRLLQIRPFKAMEGIRREAPPPEPNK